MSKDEQIERLNAEVNQLTTDMVNGRIRIKTLEDEIAEREPIEFSVVGLEVEYEGGQDFDRDRMAERFMASMLSDPKMALIEFSDMDELACNAADAFIAYAKQNGGKK